MTRTMWCPALVGLLLAGAGCAEAVSMTQETLDPPDARCGIAAAFPGDRGISSHPAVVLHEDFEHRSHDTLEGRFQSVRNPENLAFVPDVPAESGGEFALQMRSVGGRDTGAHLYRQFDRAHDRLHLRYYVRYDRGHRYHHTGGGLGGYNPPTPWPQGGAGNRPEGDDRLTTRVEPMPGGESFDVYSYWMEMRGNPGDSSYWGNTFLGGVRPDVPDRQWVAVELMVRLNHPPDEANGELALWLDGELVHHLRPGEPRGDWVWDTFHPDSGGAPFEGFRWRSHPDLGLNFVSLSHYVTGHDHDEESHVYFNDVVLATEYIGPIGGSPCEEMIRTDRR